METNFPITNFVQSNVSGGSITTDPTYKPGLVVDKYNLEGDLQEQHKVNDIHTCYLWGYNNMYPVAQIVGADYVTSSALVDLSILNNPSTEAALQTELNKIRSGLASTKALVTTYTYKPLVGMISQTDPNGITTYYEYDAFGRLSQIRDKDNHILKKYCYNFFGQPEPCTSVGNEVQSGSFTSNCAGGGPVNYAVAANTYFAATLAEANQLAQQDVAQNGQAYADSHGSCTYYNVAMTQTFYRNCGRPLIGTPVDYSVAAGTYSASSQAAANQLAQDDINANGQAYAETHGNCYSPSACSNCTGPDKKCINYNCEAGVLVYTSQQRSRQGVWACIYHYEWSDGTWSQNYVTYSTTPCY